MKIQQQKKRFNREAKTIAQLEHAAIVPVYDVGEYQEQPYIVMRYMAGDSLKEYLQKKGPLSLEKAIEICSRIAKGLNKVHGKGIIHRDLKPGNILFDEEENPYIADFGIVKFAEASSLTTASILIGTPAYMSPEQIEAERELDARSDIYSLAVILFEMISGEQPYKANTPLGVVTAHLNKPIPRVIDLRNDLPEAIQKIIEKGMAKKREERYSSVMEFSQELKGIGKTIFEDSATIDDISNNDGITRDRSQVWMQNNKKWQSILVFGIIFSILILVYFFLSNKSPEKEKKSKDPTHTQILASQIMSEKVVEISQTSSLERNQISSGATKKNPLDEANLVYISSGEFEMGLTEKEVDYLQLNSQYCSAALDLSIPRHKVFLDGYWIYRTEITNAMYKLCVNDGVCSSPKNSYSKERTDYFTNPKYKDYPVVFVSWIDADNYCNWAGGRLPTEAEWEKAARGTDNRLFPWGNDFPVSDLANTTFSKLDTEPVDSYPLGASPYGVYNLAGNVYEWVADWFSATYYQSSPYENPTGPSNLSGELDRRVVRGGAFTYDLGCACSATHDWWEYYEAGYAVGFRCVVDE